MNKVYLNLEEVRHGVEHNLYRVDFELFEMGGNESNIGINDPEDWQPQTLYVDAIDTESAIKLIEQDYANDAPHHFYQMRGWIVYEAKLADTET